MQLRELKRFARPITAVAGALVAIGLGLLCLEYSFAEPLQRASYDLPFLWRSDLKTQEIVLVYLDEESAKQLNQPIDDAWNRSLHVSLLERLTADGARLVMFDIVFDTPSPDPAKDEALAAALQRFGKAVLGAALDLSVGQERIVPPLRSLRKAASWGLLAFRPIDTDYGVRRLFNGTEAVPSATWRAAELLNAPVTNGPRELPQPRWMNYYGPADTFASVNFAKALEPDGVPPGFFKDKIVLVGGHSLLGYLTAKRDEFRTPYSRKIDKRGPQQYTPGLEVHATALLNLLRGDWLTRLAGPWEYFIVIVVGLIAGALAALRISFAVLSTVLISFALAAFSSWLVWDKHIWFNWLVPAVIQLPFGLAWSVGSQYLLESRRRKELRRAFGFYLSPQMADKIADSDFDLKPGGKVADVTVIFTDLESFTTMSENLEPTEVAEILTSYFGQTTKCILENKGTIIKYIGDAVFAAWGAPIDDPQHATRAVETACDLRCLSELEVRGKTLRTRVGIHCGKVVAGNLGSSYRFDYTMIGDPVNFASRLESLNKYLSTQVLISDAVRQQLDNDSFIIRRLGEFRVAGKTNSVVIHELLCRCDAEAGERAWIDVFERGLEQFRRGDFEAARNDMDRTRTLRGGMDGPSEFYLRKISALQSNGKREGWTGIVELSEK